MIIKDQTFLKCKIIVIIKLYIKFQFKKLMLLLQQILLEDKEHSK